MKYYGGVEGGGTNINCIVASNPDHILAEHQFPTTKPDQVLNQVVSFFNKVQIDHQVSLSKIGLAFFGPLDLDSSSINFGKITSTPKPGWRNFPLVSEFQNRINVPVMIDTDVNAAALAEGRWGAARGYTDFIYLTIGTGIGGGVISASKPVHGMLHPELGHMIVNHDKVLDPFEGVCPYHKDCLEGLASGSAMAARWNKRAEELPIEHPAWDLEAHYLALALHNLLLSFSPQKIILGGGVMNQPGLIVKIRPRLFNSINGYVETPQFEHLDEYIVSPGLKDRSGVLGAIALVSE